jgi:hypothetical protein
MKRLKTLTAFLLLSLVLSCSKDSGEKTITDDDGNPQTVDTAANKKSVGDSANDMLSDSNFNTIRIEIFYVAGLEPSNTTLNNFRTFLQDRLNKPGGVQIELTEIASPGQSVYSITDILNLEDDIRTGYNDGDIIEVFGIFMDGEYSENTENGSVLGVAYRNTSFVIFEETIKSFSGQPLAPSTTVLETTVLNHEFGHLLGLVNAGTLMENNHQDVDHGRHCTTDNCLMFWTAETGEGLLNMISGGNVPSLDAECLADLQANGGK